MYELKLKYTFDAAHRLEFHTGKCFNLHGHQWLVIVTINSKELKGNDMLIDFGDIKDLLSYLDHKTILKKCKENDELIAVLESMNCQCVLLDDSPTAENIAKVITEKIMKTFALKDVKTIVYESPNSSIKYYE